ncbi:hypothetical protein J6590_099908 [Homalodisca vitripennis]|nr:hypothetical protein J6590_099908 [Homalodisca vitripennis]
MINDDSSARLQIISKIRRLVIGQTMKRPRSVYRLYRDRDKVVYLLRNIKWSTDNKLITNDIDLLPLDLNSHDLGVFFREVLVALLVKVPLQAQRRSPDKEAATTIAAVKAVLSDIIINVNIALILTFVSYRKRREVFNSKKKLKESPVTSGET